MKMKVAKNTVVKFQTPVTVPKKQQFTTGVLARPMSQMPQRGHTVIQAQYTLGCCNCSIFFICRLTPALGFMIMFYMYGMYNICDGPMCSTLVTSDKNCENNSWATLLYMNNIYSSSEEVSGGSSCIYLIGVKFSQNL